MKGKVISVNISKQKGVRKEPVDFIVLKENFGIIGDVHSNTPKREVSLLSIKQVGFPFQPGLFAENITVDGVDFSFVRIGDIIKIGKCILEIAQIGKECYDECEIKKKFGRCVMPKLGVFTKVIKGGRITPLEKIAVF